MVGWIRPSIGSGHQSFSKSSESNRQWQQALDHLCTLPGTDGNGKRLRFPAEQFVSISQVLNRVDRLCDRADSRRAWYKRPRLFTVLKSIGALDCMEAFIEEDRYDIELPYDAQTLPAIISNPAQRDMLLHNQECVLTDALKLESPDQHIHFSKSDKDQFMHVRELGKGGYGSVDEVLSKLSWRLFARKRIKRAKDTVQGRKVQKAMIDEINIAKSLSHRHLIKIVGSYTDQSYIAFLMEPVADCNLETYLTQSSTAQRREHTLRQFFGCLTAAIDHLHRNQIRHRDLKPQNILVKEGQVYIADFGNAMDWSTAKRSTTQDRHGPATPFYMAPEVYERTSRNSASDMFSLGLVFLEILTVLKGSTADDWEDFVVKKAQREKKEPYPCRHLDAISDWLVHLGMIGSDPECNEPLIWIKELLRAKSEERATASRLVQMIIESPFAREHCCMDCYPDFLATDHTTHDLNDFSGNWDAQLDEDGKLSQEMANIWGLNEPKPQRQDQRTITIENWLDTAHFDHPSHVHESLSLVLDNHDRAAPYQHTTSFFPYPVPASKSEIRKSGNRNGMHSELDDAEHAVEVSDDNHDELPFNIIEDDCSDVSSDGAADFRGALESVADLATIAEDDEYDIIPETSPRAECEFEQRHKLENKHDGAAESNQWFLETVAKFNNLDAQVDANKTKSEKKKPATTPVTSLEPFKVEKKDVLPPMVVDSVNHNKNNGLPAMVIDPIEPKKNIGPSAKVANPVKSDKTNGSKVMQGTLVEPAQESSSKGSRLSAKNISKLNASNASAPESKDPTPIPINNVLDASKYIDDAWKQAEAAVSVATTAESEQSAASFNISGALLRWQDKDKGMMEACCKSGKATYLRKLLEKGCNPGTANNPRTAPLIHAIEGRSLRHVKCVKALISKGCNVNSLKNGKTPIHRLIDGGDFEGFHKLLVVLLMAGADVHAVDKAGDSVLSRLFSGGDMNAPLEEWRNIALALMLNDKIPAAPDINATERTTKNSLVHLAIKRKSPRTLALLIHKNAKVDVRNTANITPLVMAANQWLGATTAIQQQMLDTLLKAKDVDINGFGGSPRRTPLHCAVVAGCPHATKALIASGADVTLVNGDGKTALALLEQATYSSEVKQEIQTILKDAGATDASAEVLIAERERRGY